MLLQQFKKSWESKNRTIYLMSLLFVSITLALTTSFIITSYKSEVQQASQDSQNLSRLLKDQVEKTFEKVNLSLRQINYTIHFVDHKKKWTPVSYQQLLAKTTADIPEIAAIKILDRNGNYIGQSDGVVSPKLNNSDRSYFQNLKNNPGLDFDISEPVFGKTLKIWLVVVARRLYSPNREFNGVIIALIPIQLFEKMFSQIKVGHGSNIALLSLKDHILLARVPRAEKKVGQKIELAKQFQSELSLHKDYGNVLAYSTLDGTKKLYGYGSSENYDFFVTVGLAESDFLAHWYNQTLFFIVAFILVCIAIAFSLYKFTVSQHEQDVQRLSLIQASKMASLGEMAGGIAHEINNPLAIIKLQAERLRSHLDGHPELSATASPIITSIDKTIDRIVKIVAGLRTMSRHSETDGMVPCRLKKIVEDSLSLCGEKFKNYDMKLSVNSIPDVMISCRETQISQVILNLLSNSFDACLESPEKWIEISFAVENSIVHIYFTDSGNGISPEIEKKIMEPFFTTKQIGKGTGLGLSISKGIINDHKGQLYLNVKSKHTQFVCVLPISKAA